MSNITFSFVARSCNRLMVGKTYWKSVVLPSVIIGNSVAILKRDRLLILQWIENSIWRQILGGWKLGCCGGSERESCMLYF